MKKNMTKVVMTALFAAITATQGFAQTNLGTECGCPPLASRTTVNMNTLTVNGGANDGDLITNTVLTCDKIYFVDKKIFVPNGLSLTIRPGSLIKFDTSATTNAATALIVSRGGKIFASGTESCPIVMTSALDPMDGSYGVGNQQKWGGLVVLGNDFTNITSASANYVSPGVALIEGFSTSDPRGHYGNATPDPNDNSGILQYISIRHGGATIAANNELNGLTLGGVGRATTIDHIDIVANSDDGIEFFGGSVDLKYAAVWFNDDDGFDWDQGWDGRGQFWHLLQVSGKGDNGFEMDGDDNASNNTPMSHPIIYNATLIGRGAVANEGFEAKERTEGEVYNSIVAFFKHGLNVQDNGQSGRAIDAYENWVAGSLKIENCTFVGCDTALTVKNGSSYTTGSGADQTKFTTDGNTSVASLPGFDFNYAMNTSTNAVTDQYDPIPNPQVGTTTAVPGTDGFFTNVNYRGAFASSGKNWMANWTYGAFIDGANGLVPCPTDLNGDGITKIEDFNILLGQFNVSCD